MRWLGAIGALAVGLATSGQQGTGSALVVEPGVVAAFGTFGGEVNDIRVDRLLALHVPAGESPSAFVAPGRVIAHFEGVLRIRQRDRYAFTFAGAGAAKLTVDDKVLLDSGQAPTGESTRLRKGDHLFKLSYTAPASGDATMRILWETRDWRREPIPATALGHVPTPMLAGALSARRGRDLFATLRCANCHALPDAGWRATGMPELAPARRDLRYFAQQFRRDWLARWVLDPRGVRSDATMPRVVHGATGEDDARDIAAFLAANTQHGAPPAKREYRRRDERAGARLFRQLACVACHSLAGISGERGDRVPLRHVAAKWYGASLEAFLRDPDRHAPRTGMPNFALDERQARELAAFLVAKSAPVAEASAPGDAKRGRALVQTLGCRDCHVTGQEFDDTKAPPLAKIAAASKRGCLARRPGDGVPHYGLSTDDRSALQDFVAGGTASLARRVPAEYAERQLRDLRCSACHARDGALDRLASLGAELEKLPEPRVDDDAHKVLQTRPVLTWTGEKLRPKWLAKYVSGELDERMRPWLHMRMPAFHVDAGLLARGLAAQHGYGVAPALEDPGDQASSGKRLVSKNGGFDCTTCHSVGDTDPVAVFEVLGVNLKHVKQRLRKDWFMRWMRNPLRFDPATRMPKYADERGKTAIPVLGGDAEQQFEAIWQFLRQGRDIDLGK